MPRLVGACFAAPKCLDRNFSIGPEPVVPGTPLRLSRFAYIHRTERGLVLDSPETSCTLALGATLPLAAEALMMLVTAP